MPTGPVVSGGQGGQVLVKRANSNMTDWVDATYVKLDSDRTFYVSPPGEGGTGDGSSAANGFKTVQAAIDAVAGLDVDGKYVVTVQLAPGVYPENVFLKDPAGSAHRLDYSDVYQVLRHSCVLRGNPLNPAAHTLYCVTGIASTAWKLEGLRLDSGGFGPLQTSIYLDFGSYLPADDIDFHVSAAMTSLAYVANYSTLMTGPQNEVRHCKITKSGIASSLLNVWYAFRGGYIQTGSDIDCTHAALAIDGIWAIAAESARIVEYNNYLNAENLTGGKRYDVSFGSVLTFRRFTSLPGSSVGTIDHTSKAIPNNAVYEVTTDMWPLAAPTGGALIQYTPGQTLQSQFLGRTITNQGATAIAPFVLPGWEVLPYYIGPDSPTGAFGFKFNFVVQDADGIRITATAGMTIRSTTNVGGKIESTAIGSSLTILNVSATEWMVTSQLGVWTVTAQLTNSVAPTVSPATAGQNAAVTCAIGTWSAAAVTTHYQWFKNGSLYLGNGGSGNPFTIDANFAPGDTLKCKVSIIDATGTGSVAVLSSNQCTVT